jgi:hypothetical protein
MSLDAKALVVVLALAVPAFYLGGQIAGPFVPRREFVIWRNCWFLVTLAAFLSVRNQLWPRANDRSDALDSISGEAAW